MFLLMVCLTGIVYPLAVWIVAQTFMKDKADGSFIGSKGSKLIAQKFTSERYFWPRPSSCDYNPLPSGASNLGPISPALKKQVDERRAMYHTADVPADLLFATGSGLDPHISPHGAYFQIDRISLARGIKKEALTALVKAHIEWSLFGRPCVNVLILNLALDELQNGRRTSQS
jgi:potassium-transporting ATPase KdpC subunit